MDRADRDAVRRGYDVLAEAYAAERGGDPGDRFSELLDRLPDQPRVLDAGCGNGRPVLDALDTTGSAVGLDLSEEQVRRATENVPTARVVQGDLSTLPFRGDRFDGVTAYHSLIHVPLAEHVTAIEEFARVLRPGGWVLLSEGSEEWTGSNPDWLDTGVEMHWSMAGPEATRGQLRAVGFEIVREWSVGDDLADDDDASMS
ncbi:MAG: class I SAM-dependent methyltransferase, partial [Halalkalicoccus sp.]